MAFRTVANYFSIACSFSFFVNNNISFLCSIEKNSIVDDETTKKLKEILVRNQLVSIDLLEELEINYF